MNGFFHRAPVGRQGVRPPGGETTKDRFCRNDRPTGGATDNRGANRYRLSHASGGPLLGGSIPCFTGTTGVSPEAVERS
jgi:hypothetical protein